MAGPFDRFNDRAKRVLALAQDEAIRFNHNYMGVEHLLLGLIREGEGVAAKALDALGVELSKARTAVQFIIGRGDATTSPSEITLTPRLKKVIELAIDESRKLGHSHVGTEHLLLGVVREGGSVATGVLESLGLSLENVREKVIATIGQTRSDQMRPQYGPFGRGAQSGDDTTKIALDEAKALNHDWLGTEHILLAILKVANTRATRALATLSIDYDKAKAEIVKAVPARDSAPKEITVTPRAQKVVGYAMGFGDASGMGLSPESLLLGLVREGDGIAAQTLLTLGATADDVRNALNRVP